MKLLLTIGVVLVFIMATVDTSMRETLNKTNNNVKKGRLFSLFSIVQFPNDACTSTSTTYTTGSCLTLSQCSSSGGTSRGTCASGFGVCCTFSISATGSIVTQNLTYITNPGYPSSFSTSVTSQTYTINKVSSDICRIRLDLEAFALKAPITAAADITTDGQCSTDRLEFTTTSETTTPAVGAAGSYGNYPYICGIMTGETVFLDVGCSLDSTTGACTDDTATLAFTLANTNTYKIKVSQLSCLDDCVAPQAGCFQYFTGVTGTVKSFNFLDTTNPMHLAAQNYKACIRQEAGYCCIDWMAATFKVHTGTCAALATRCVTASACSVDYVLIPGGRADSASVTTYDRYCGSALHEGGFPLVNGKVRSCRTPFELGFVTDKTSNDAATVGDAGFSISYTQVAC